MYNNACTCICRAVIKIMFNSNFKESRNKTVLYF